MCLAICIGRDRVRKRTRHVRERGIGCDARVHVVEPRRQHPQLLRHDAELLLVEREGTDQQRSFGHVTRRALDQAAHGLELFTHAHDRHRVRRLQRNRFDPWRRRRCLCAGRADRAGETEQHGGGVQSTVQGDHFTAPRDGLLHSSAARCICRVVPQESPKVAGKNRVLDKMLERLFASLANGPSLNARPHSSRQRVDLTHVARLADRSAEDVFRDLLAPERSSKLKARVPQPLVSESDVDPKDQAKLAEARAAREKWDEQQAFLHKLRIIAEDARTYEQDTGVHVLNLGFPLLSLPPGALSTWHGGGATRRVLAPVAFIPIKVTVKRGATQTVDLACKGEGVDLVVPNTALLAWLEQQTGKPPAEMDPDEAGQNPWREVCQLVAHVCASLEIETPELFRAEPTVPDRLSLKSAPRADETPSVPTLIPSAVLGLFPMANQGLLRDMQAMAVGESLSGPVKSFIHSSVHLDAQLRFDDRTTGPLEKRSRSFVDERLVAAADPCQSRAVDLARECKGLVVHGPPGTGKSQTITNVIGDHLSRGHRVLLLCDKRTALDVVANRLTHMGFGKLFALVHDPQRDQRELYRMVREQLDDLPEARSDDRAEAKLAKVDHDLQALHSELTRVHAALMTRDEATGMSFHELVGEWLTLTNAAQAGDGGDLKEGPVSL